MKEFRPTQPLIYEFKVNNAWNIFKVDDVNDFVLMCLLLNLKILDTLFWCSIVDFEQVNAHLVWAEILKQINSGYCLGEQYCLLCWFRIK